MADLDEGLVVLAGIDSEQRQDVLREYQGFLTEPFLDLVDNELHWTTGVAFEWPGVPEVVTDTLRESLSIWNERVGAVRADLFVVAEELMAAAGTAPVQAADASSAAPAAAASSHSPAIVNLGTSAASGPTEDEIVADFVAWDRQEHESQVEQRDYWRLRDDDIAYDTYQSYDSYQSDDTYGREY